MSDEREWDVSKLENNLANHIHDGDAPAVSCPECESFGAIDLSLFLDEGTITCEFCGAEFGLRLVEQRPNDE